MVIALDSGSSGPDSSPGTRFLKAPKTFAPVKPFLVLLFLKTERCMRLKLLV